MAEEKKNRSEELESLDKKINEIINGQSGGVYAKTNNGNTYYLTQSV